VKKDENLFIFSNRSRDKKWDEYRRPAGTSRGGLPPSASSSTSSQRYTDSRYDAYGGSRER
jgi:hypothetical protein